MKYSAMAALALATFSLYTVPAAAEGDSWEDRISFNGDFRLRFESIDIDDQVRRDRMRLRAQFGMNATISDNVEFIFQLSTGAPNPVSTNQTLGNGFSTKDIGVNLAYVDWKMADGMNLLLGKMKNPLFKAGGTQLIWDGDLTMEGVAFTYRSGKLFSNVGAFSVEERSVRSDSLIYAAQLGWKQPLGENSALTAGVGYFGYTNTVGNLPFYNALPRGNTVELIGTPVLPLGTYVYDYKNTEVFAQFDTNIADWPFQFYTHATWNNEVSSQDMGYIVGVKMGTTKKEGDMQFGLAYEELEADAVIGTFSDSDFGGGGTDSNGYILKGKYMLRKRISVAGTLFINKVDRYQGVELDYSRLQLDVQYKFN